MMEWQPIETAPENTDILTYADFDDAQPVGVSRFRWVTEIVDDVEKVINNAKGRRLIIQERTVKKREWEGRHWEPTHWMPLPPPPGE